MATDPKAVPASSRAEALPQPVKIFSYPKIIFTWPTFLAAIICGVGMLLIGDETRKPSKINPPVAVKAVAAAPKEGEPAPAKVETVEPLTTTEVANQRNFSSWQNIFGVFFLAVFALNVLVMAIDFPRFTIIALMLLLSTFFFLILWLGLLTDILPFLSRAAEHLYLVANSGFYFACAGILLIAYAVIFVIRHLDYWEIRANEILHHHGPLSDLERYPTTNLRFDKEIPDVLEYLMGFGAGRLVLNIGGEPRPVILDHVLFINAKEEALKQLMGKMNVRVIANEDVPE